MTFVVSPPVAMPLGSPIRVVPNDDLGLQRSPLMIEAPLEQVPIIARKYWDYRFWFKMRDPVELHNAISDDGSGDIAAAIRRLYEFNLRNQTDPSIVEGVESVTLFFPLNMKDRVVRQLSNFPPCLDTHNAADRKIASKSIHIATETGTKSLAVLEHGLDVIVPDPRIGICLNNPNAPAWEVRIPPQGPMPLMVDGPSDDAKRASEETAWDQFVRFLAQEGRVATGTPYPNGSNEFPDFGGIIDGEHYHVEMTTLPDMQRWTIPYGNRDLEKTIRDVASQPHETLAEVTEHLIRMVEKKTQRVDSYARNGTAVARPCILVLTNRSGHDLRARETWDSTDLSAFAAVFSIWGDTVRQIK